MILPENIQSTVLIYNKELNLEVTYVLEISKNASVSYLHLQVL